MNKKEVYDGFKILGSMLLLVLATALFVTWMASNSIAAKQAQLTSWEPCTFLRAHDGDTFWCKKDDNKVIEVRLQSVDTPELAQKPLGQQAKQALDSLMTEGPLEVYCPGQKSYERLVCAARVNDEDVGTSLLALGLACLDERYTKQDISRAEHVEALEMAQAEKIGMWALPNPVCGYDFRRKTK
jgi:endonuclease YncB( thermonuclease family)